MELRDLSTGRGDEGFSSLKDGKKLRKDSSVFETLGSLDKVSSYLGLAKASIRNKKFKTQLTYIQGIFYRIGSIIADSVNVQESKLEKLFHPRLKKIEEMEATLLKKLQHEKPIILPGKSKTGAQIDVARTLCREFERRLTSYIYDEKWLSLKPLISVVNRISDYLYALARYIEKEN